VSRRLISRRSRLAFAHANSASFGRKFPRDFIDESIKIDTPRGAYSTTAPASDSTRSDSRFRAAPGVPNETGFSSASLSPGPGPPAPPPPHPRPPRLVSSVSGFCPPGRGEGGEWEKKAGDAIPRATDARRGPTECSCARILKELVARGRRLQPNQPLFPASHAARVPLSGGRDGAGLSGHDDIAVSCRVERRDDRRMIASRDKREREREREGEGEKREGLALAVGESSRPHRRC